MLQKWICPLTPCPDDTRLREPSTNCNESIRPRLTAVTLDHEASLTRAYGAADRGKAMQDIGECSMEREPPALRRYLHETSGVTLTSWY